MTENKGFRATVRVSAEGDRDTGTVGVTTFDRVGCFFKCVFVLFIICDVQGIPKAILMLAEFNKKF